MDDLGLILGLTLSLAIGLSLSLIGGGGSSITVPVLVYVMGIPVRDAIPMSLAVVASTSALAALRHRRRGHVRLGSAAVFAAAGAISSFIASDWTDRVSDDVLLLGSAAVMFLAAWRMLRNEAPEGNRAESAGAPSDLPRIALSGLGVGVLTGFLGVGGGSLIVPALTLFVGLGLREAIGTSLVVIACNCVAGLVGHARSIDWETFPVGTTLLVVGVAALGTLIGAAIAPKMSARALRRLFAVVIVGIALAMVFGVVHGSGRPTAPKATPLGKGAPS